MKTKIKWYAPNGVSVTIDDKQVFLTKRELRSLRDNILDFMHFYKEDFTPETIDYVPAEGWYDE